MRRLNAVSLERVEQSFRRAFGIDENHRARCFARA